MNLALVSVKTEKGIKFTAVHAGITVKPLKKYDAIKVLKRTFFPALYAYTDDQPQQPNPRYLQPHANGARVTALARYTLTSGRKMHYDFVLMYCMEIYMTLGFLKASPPQNNSQAIRETVQPVRICDPQ